MKQEPKISIIIPMYNTEKYIEQCLKSIINQTYQNLEIIIVNDGSTDSSRQICEKYVEKDNRIKLINTENRGASSARNTGIEESTGKYISFIDSDDYICQNYYEKLYKMLEDSKADIAVGRYKRVYENDGEPFTNSGVVRECTNQESLLELYGEDDDKYINNVLMINKLFRKELFKDGIRFPSGRLIDDEFIIYKVIYKSKKIVYTDDIMYAYVQSSSSIMRSNFKAKRVYDTIDVYDEVYEFFKEKDNQELNKKILIRYLNYCVELAQKTSESSVIDDKETIYKYLEQKFNQKQKEAQEKIEPEKYKKIYQEFYKVIDETKVTM